MAVTPRLIALKSNSHFCTSLSHSNPILVFCTGSSQSNSILTFVRSFASKSGRLAWYFNVRVRPGPDDAWGYSIGDPLLWNPMLVLGTFLRRLSLRAPRCVRIAYLIRLDASSFGIYEGAPLSHGHAASSMPVCLLQVGGPTDMT